jgi:hypothetical protein
MFVLKGKEATGLKLNKKGAHSLASLISDSTCKVMIFRGKDGLFGLHIEFTGPLAHFPSTSNDRAMHVRWGRDKATGIRKKFHYIGHSNECRLRLDAATRVFTAALMQSGHALPCFHDEQVKVIGLFAHKKGRWDSHNQCKPLGDWLQSIGVINDDTNASITCEKKSWYPARYPDQDRTLITVQAFSQVRSLMDETIQEMLQTSTGALKLVG